MNQATYEKALSFLRSQIALVAEGFAPPPTTSRDIFSCLKQYVLDFLSGDVSSRFIILSGLRGSGKTTLLTQVFSEVSSTPSNRKLFISLDKLAALNLSLSDVLEVYEKGILATPFERLDEPVFLFLDEVQYDEKWMVVLKTIFDRTDKVCIFATGSAALMLRGSRVGADVARRARYESLFPMNFTEYLRIKHGVSDCGGVSDAIRDAFFESRSAEDLFNRLKCVSQDVTRCLVGVNPSEKDWYVKYGSLPFVLSEKKERDIYTRIYQVVERVVRVDMLVTGTFERGTIGKVLELLYLVAHSDKVSVEKLCRSLNLSRPAVMNILEALEHSEMLLRIPAYGSVNNRTRKSSKYTFFSSSTRSALFNTLGTSLSEKIYTGKLLEDVVAMYLYRVFVCDNVWHLSYDSKKGGADFILTRAGRNIVFEVGLGSKDSKQVSKTLKKTRKDSFGVIISSDKLSINKEKTIVTIPLEMFLLM